MTKILMIANQFPPMGGAGVQRTLKFVKYLNKFGFKTTLISREYDGELKDESLISDIPKDINIYKLPAYDLENKKGILRIPCKILGRYLVSPDAEYYWYKKNRDRVLRIVEEEAPDIIYSSSYPYSAHLLALHIKKQLNIKWICDFRDEWTNNPFHLDSFYKRIRLKKEKKMELEVTSNCDWLITNTSFMLDNFIKDNKNILENSCYIPNGYDEDDFAGFDMAWNKGDKFIITHTGSLYGRRKLDEFLDAIAMLISEDRIDKKDLEIRIVGNVHEHILNDYRAKYNLNNEIKSYGYLAHKESIKMLFESKALLLLIGKGKGSENFYTGKIFEYIRADRPIIGIVPVDGAAGRLIKETERGLVANPDDLNEIASIIEQIYLEWKNGLNLASSDKDKILKYSRENQTKDLINIINKLIRR